MEPVAKRVLAAHSAARDAQNTVAHLSAARLASITAMPAKTAAQHLEDPSLTAEDRAVLQHWLRQKLPSRWPNAARRVSGLPRALRWVLRFPRLILLAFGLLVCAGLAWYNTPATIGTGKTVRSLDIVWPGRSQPQQLPADTMLGVVGYTSTEWHVRVWQPSMGYAVVTLGADDIQVQLAADE